jgi:hypothetical protein
MLLFLISKDDLVHREQGPSDEDFVDFQNLKVVLAVAN